MNERFLISSPRRVKSGSGGIARRSPSSRMLRLVCINSVCRNFSRGGTAAIHARLAMVLALFACAFPSCVSAPPNAFIIAPCPSYATGRQVKARKTCENKRGEAARKPETNVLPRGKVGEGGVEAGGRR